MGSVVHGQALIRGPAIVGNNTVVDSHVEIRAGSFIGSNCVIGRNAMVYVPRRKMGGKRESIRPCADDSDDGLAHDCAFVDTRPAPRDPAAVDRKKRGIALRPN
jgi:NDP-sugar pyrophosphorylase family protein